LKSPPSARRISRRRACRRRWKASETRAHRVFRRCSRNTPLDAPVWIVISSIALWGGVRKDWKSPYYSLHPASHRQYRNEADSRRVPASEVKTYLNDRGTLILAAPRSRGIQSTPEDCNRVVEFPAEQRGADRSATTSTTSRAGCAGQIEPIRRGKKLDAAQHY